MPRLFPICLLLLAASLHAADESEATVTNVATAGNRYFLLVETSGSMKAQREVALDTVNKLLLGGVNGRLRTNDTLTVWAYSDRLHTNLLNDLAWDPHQRLDTANRAYRLLRDLSSSKKPNMELAMDALKQAASAPGVLTAILVYSGSQPIQGTPFDNLVNEITGPRREDMRKSGKPFITAFIARDGRYLAHAVTPGGRPVYLPPLPKPLPKPAVTNPPPLQASALVTNKPRPLTVEEIEESLRKSRKPANSPAPPASLVATNAASTPPLSSPLPPPTTASPNTPAVEAAPAPAATAPAAVTPLTAPSVVSNTAPISTPGPASSRSVPASPPSTGASLIATSHRPAGASPQSAVVLPPRPASRSWSDLATGIALLLAAGALAWVLMRNLRSRPHPSLISRSLDDEPK